MLHRTIDSLVGEDHQPPRIVVALAHPAMRRYVCDVIEAGCQCWLATAIPATERFAGALAALDPDVVVTDRAGLKSLDGDPRRRVNRVVVIGPDDRDYRRAGLAAGVGAWVSEDNLPRDLVPGICHLLGHTECRCAHNRRHEDRT
jgi:DNA-binding NarL/FixJ family response regulator